MLEFEEYKQKINALKPSLITLQTALKTEEAMKEIEELEAESAKDGFWNDMERSQKVLKRIKQLKSKCDNFKKLKTRYEDLITLCQMGLEEGDESLLPELIEEYDKFEKDLETARLSTLLSGEYDGLN